jgi:oxygen-independent coproporphyrinogen-3 oxidase
MLPAVPDAPRHVYVHVPFCARRCSYCDFAIAVRAHVPVDEYVDALERELTVRLGTAPAPDARPPIDTLYFGGGTPSRLGGAGVARAAETLSRWFAWDDAAEVTLEVNPDDVTPDAARAWRAQASRALRSAARRSTRPPSRGCDAATPPSRSSAPSPTSAPPHRRAIARPDLRPPRRGHPRLAGRPGSRARPGAHAPVSYGLTVEPGTPLGRWTARGDVREADEDRYADEFTAAHALLTAAGYEHYEVSNFARPGRRARHNSAYWRGVPYLGLGPSAHGFDGRRRRWNASAYAEWARTVAAGQDPIAGDEAIDGDAAAAEMVYLGLRTRDGLVLASGEAERTGRWVDAGWGELDGDRLRLTAAGWLRLDALAADLTAFRVIDRLCTYVIAGAFGTGAAGPHRRHPELRRHGGARRVTHALAPVRPRRVAGDDPQHDE